MCNNSPAERARPEDGRPERAHRRRPVSPSGRQVGGRSPRAEAWPVMARGARRRADLGASSRFGRASECRRGLGFRVAAVGHELAGPNRATTPWSGKGNGVRSPQRRRRGASKRPQRGTRARSRAAGPVGPGPSVERQAVKPMVRVSVQRIPRGAGHLEKLRTSVGVTVPITAAGAQGEEPLARRLK